MAVQRQGWKTLRGHYVRLWLRVAVLVAADLLTFGILQRLMLLVREQAILGAGVAAWMASVFPPGWVGGEQFAAAMILGLAVAGVYGRGDLRKSGSRILGGVSLAAGLTLWTTLWTAGFSEAAVQFTALVVVVTTAVFLNRNLVDKLLPRVFQRIGPPEAVLFVGEADRPHSKAIESTLLGTGRMRSVGWASTAPERGPSRTPVVQPLANLWEVARERRPDVIVICGTLSNEDFQRVVEVAGTAGARLMGASRYDDLAGVRPRLSWVQGMPLVELQMPVLKAHHLVAKRALDLAGSSLGLLLLSPLLALIALAVKLDSKGPVFFSHERVGIGGKTFRMWKFRTMVDGADAMKEELHHLNSTGDSRLFKIREDPRMTRLGRFLRKWSLDELPQLWNVLKGEMSLVGPRPFFERDLVEYERDHFARLGAKPGITGLWQISGRSDVIDFEEVVRLDRQYIDGWSVWFDLYILLRTLPAVFNRRGAH